MQGDDIASIESMAIFFDDTFLTETCDIEFGVIALRQPSAYPNLRRSRSRLDCELLEFRVKTSNTVPRCVEKRGGVTANRSRIRGLHRIKLE